MKIKCEAVLVLFREKNKFCTAAKLLADFSTKYSAKDFWPLEKNKNLCSHDLHRRLIKFIWNKKRKERNYVDALHNYNETSATWAE